MRTCYSLSTLFSRSLSTALPTATVFEYATTRLSTYHVHVFLNITAVFSLLALFGPRRAAADTIPERDAAHFFTEQNPMLVLGPEGDAVSGTRLVAVLPGDGGVNDQTAFFSIFGTGIPGPLVVRDMCVSTANVTLDSRTDALRLVDCAPDMDDPA
ncbi:hypothetical protein C8Q79DRAFT_930184 [Trametes meyenii]|nr:hypothetical protein C8Q79DRAFT_930184 [Trametes meyenii]